jgi:hypothetical protein
MLQKYASARKAVFAGVGAGLTALQLSLADGVLTSTEWRNAAIAALIVGFAAYTVPNG